MPGLAPAARRVLRGRLPTLDPADASLPIEVAPIVFEEYKPTPEDVYDWVDVGGKQNLVAIVSINGLRRGQEGYRALERQLAGGEGLDKLQVEWSLIGTPEQATKAGLDPVSVAKKSKGNRSIDPGSRWPQWSLRRSVENLYEQAVRLRLGIEPVDQTMNLRGLLEAAKEMAAIGRTGKEDREGWRRAIVLLERARAVAEKAHPPEVQAEVLVLLVEAFQALKDEQAALRALTAYAKAVPTRAEPWVRLGDLALTSLGLPEQALTYFERARSIEPTNERVALGQGDAYTLLGRDKDALAAYARAGSTFESQVRRSEASLRLGEVAQARQAADAALALKGDHPRALIARGAALYAGRRPRRRQGCLRDGGHLGRRGRRVARPGALRPGPHLLAPGRDACGGRGLHGLGGRAAHGRLAGSARRRDRLAQPGPGPDRARAQGPRAGRSGRPGGRAGRRAPAQPLEISKDAVGEYLSAARDEAARTSYLEHVAGALATSQGNTAAAVRALRRALVLAPDASELDGWLAINHLRWGMETAGRAASSEPVEAHRRRDPGRDGAAGCRARPARSRPPRGGRRLRGARGAGRRRERQGRRRSTLREAWVRLQAQHLTARQRFESARATCDRILKRSEVRDLVEQPAALCMRAYASYRLGGDENYDACQQDLNLVLGKVKDDKAEPWFAWREWADKTLTRVKHWRSLEEKVVSFEGVSQLTKEWAARRAHAGEGRARTPNGASSPSTARPDKDGSLAAPTVAAISRPSSTRRPSRSCASRCASP